MPLFGKVVQFGSSMRRNTMHIIGASKLTRYPQQVEEDIEIKEIHVVEPPDVV
jgi:hypothetical protein